MLAEEMKVPFRFLDPIRLDYKLVTETFGGPFASAISSCRWPTTRAS
jgi:hypothetical protein